MPPSSFSYPLPEDYLVSLPTFFINPECFCQVDGVRYLVSAEEKIIITRHYGPFIASKYRKEKMKLMQLSTMGLHSSNGKNLKKIGFNY